jgi:hypothetical protein
MIKLSTTTIKEHTMASSIELDFASSDTAKRAASIFRDSLSEAGWSSTEIDELTLEPVTDAGPGAGAPVVRMASESDETLYAALLVYADGDDAWADEALAEAQES